MATPHAGPSNQTECMTEYCLFNVSADPCEYHNLAFEQPEVVAALKEKLAVFQVRTGYCGLVFVACIPCSPDEVLPGSGCLCCYSRRGQKHCAGALLEFWARRGVAQLSFVFACGCGKQATAVPPVKGEGCAPIQINVTGLNMPVWQPCDAPAVLEQQQQDTEA